MTEDRTEAARRALRPTMPAELAKAKARGERIWTTDELANDFEVEGFAAPFVVVRRLVDGQRGTLQFTHSPRRFFGWMEDPE